MGDFEFAYMIVFAPGGEIFSDFFIEDNFEFLGLSFLRVIDNIFHI